MDATANTLEQYSTPPYTTSKQVQAWFLRRSRDNWKTKYADLKVETRRLKQHVADADRSRAKWRGEAEQASQEFAKLQAETSPSDRARRRQRSTKKKRRTSSLFSLMVPPSVQFPPATASP